MCISQEAEQELELVSFHVASMVLFLPHCISPFSAPVWVLLKVDGAGSPLQTPHHSDDTQIISWLQLFFKSHPALIQQWLVVWYTHIHFSF